MSEGLEKRKLLRLDYPLEVSVHIVPVKEAQGSKPPLHIKSHNISKDGICLETKALEVEGVNLLSGHPFAREHRLFMKVELIPHEELFEATGEVRWYNVSPDTPESIYRVGVAFTDIKDNGKELLSRFLKSHNNNGGYLHKLFK